MSNDQVPLYRPRGLSAVPPEIYGELVAAVVRTAVSPEDAEKVVDAVMGPLKLLPPPPEREARISCDSMYFTYEGVWHFCVKGHDDPDDDPAFHRSDSDDSEDWDDEDNDPRVFCRSQLTRFG